ncbi:winged helix DNA-binding domain-containing protein [Georgenia deserti]|uniref:Winged helix DNA-binding domain-containing protein n=1 Tax=Georgenia deserti TaxID=2093781 RepID=A0ABW4L2Q2_9MICO
MTTAELGLLRLVAQRVAGPGLPRPADVVRHLTAMQAQAFPAAVEAVTVRTADRDPDAVVGALNSGEIVRSWPMRGTLHLVPAEDLGWMLDITGQRQTASSARRRAELGVDATVIERASTVATDALSGGLALSRDELVTLWREAGLIGPGQAGAHLLSYLAQRGQLVLGPVRDRRQRIVLTEEWITAPRRLVREEALGEWARRYFRSHGPATVRDFAWWTKLTLADARIGLDLARPELDRLEVDGTTYHLDPEVPERLAGLRRAARRPLLLPAFDEIILGYQDRSAVLTREEERLVVPGGNGVFRPIIASGGRVVGTWRREGARRDITIEPFTTLRPAAQRAALGLIRQYPTAPVTG